MDQGNYQVTETRKTKELKKMFLIPIILIESWRRICNPVIDQVFCKLLKAGI